MTLPDSKLYSCPLKHSSVFFTNFHTSCGFYTTSSVQSLSRVRLFLSVVSDSLQPHELQHARPPCPSPTLRVHSDSHPSSPWCHPAISSSVVSFSSCPQSLPASKSFPMSQHFAWGGQSTGVSALASFLPKKSQGWSPSEWTGWTSFFLNMTKKDLAVQHEHSNSGHFHPPYHDASSNVTWNFRNSTGVNNWHTLYICQKDRICIK